MAKRILFQGDSITDCGRNREDFYGMGEGYPYLIKGTLGMEAPEEYEFINRGVSGNRIVDLYARIKLDIINLKPDYLCIYIGVNDTWHEISRQNGVDTKKFEMIYVMLIDEIKQAGFEGHYTDHGLGIFPTDALGNPFTAAFIGITGNPIVDLNEDLAAEAKAKADAEAKVKADAAAAEAAAAQKKIEDERAEELALLREIRDSLKK